MPRSKATPRRLIQNPIALLCGRDVVPRKLYAMERVRRDALTRYLQKRMAKEAALHRMASGAGARPDTSTMASAAATAYRSTPTLAGGQWELVKSTPTLKFWLDAPEKTMLVATRGTDDTRDIMADVRLAVNALRGSRRYREDQHEVRLMQEADKYPTNKYDWYGTGHSLGGAIIDLFIEDNLIKSAVTFNPAVQPKDLSSNETRNERHYVKGDPLHALLGHRTKVANTMHDSLYREDAMPHATSTNPFSAAWGTLKHAVRKALGAHKASNFVK